MNTEPGKSKYQRFNIPGNAHHLSFSCYRNRKFLNYDRTRKYIVEAINRARDIHQFELWAYILMPEHVHLLIYPKGDDYSISNILKSIKQSTARKAIKYLRDNNSGILKFMETGLKKPAYRFWQDGGGYDRNIRNDKEFLNTVDYIHNNPVRRGLVKHPKEWYWSSARDWLTDQPGPIPIDKESFPIM